jgi:lysozyme
MSSKLTSAQSTNAEGIEWIDLENEPSRSELFSTYIVPKDSEGKSIIGSRSFDLRGPFVFPTNALRDGANERKNSIFGIDISHHNGESLEFDGLRQQHIRFVYMKASQGARFRDPMFSSNWQSIGRLNGAQSVRRGAYHFLSADADPIRQAEAFLKMLEISGGLQRNDMPPVVDLEWDFSEPNSVDRWSNYSPDDIVKKTLDWLRYIKEKTGRRPMVYTSHEWWRQRGIPEAEFGKFAEYGLWIANYSESRRASERPTTPNNAKWHLWQFTDRARLSAGYPRPGGVDADIFHGTEADFEEAFDLKDE